MWRSTFSSVSRAPSCSAGNPVLSATPPALGIFARFVKILEDESVAEAFNLRIRENGYVQMHFSASEPEVPHGPPLAVAVCTECHSFDGGRSPLYHVHDRS